MMELQTFLRDYLAPSGNIHCGVITPDPFEPKNAVDARFFGNDWQSATAWVQTENAKGRNAYWTANLVTPGLNRKPKKVDIVGIRCAHVDIDPPKNNPAWDKQAAYDDLIKRGAPSVIIDSGNGWQALWWLSEQTDVATIEQINRGIADRFNADHCWNVDRLLRLPGTINHPDKKKQALGRVPAPSALVQPFNGASYAPAALLTAFPSSPIAESHIEELPDGPCEGYTGPADDTELVRLMLNSRGGDDILFGKKASFRDLWKADIDALKKFFPSDSDEFGRSEAELALLAHLAFYTGRDGKRMDRLFRKSGLYRDKWERDSYRAITIGKALSGSSAFYNVVKIEKPVHVQPAAEMPGLPGVTHQPTKWITVDDLVRDYAYFPASSRPVIPVRTDDPNAGMGYENFKRDMSKWSLADEHGKSVNPAHAWQYRQERLTVHGVGMRPDKSVPVYHEGDKAFVNTYYPPEHNRDGGTVETGLRFLSHLIPDEIERRWFMRWLAFKFRFPAVPGIGVIMVAHGVHGTGRGSLTNQLLPALFGARYVSKVELSDLTGRDGQSQFNDFAADSLIVTVDEASDDGSSPRYAQRRKAYDSLKTLVEPAARQMRVKRKFGSNGSAWTFASYLICTNHRDAIAIPSDDRRFAILSNGVRMPDELRFAFHEWVVNPANVAAFARHLELLDLGDYSPYRDPPVTGAKLDMADAALSDVDRAVADALSDEEWLPAQCFTVGQVIALIAMKSPFHEWRLPEDWEPVAKKAVHNVAHRIGVRNGKNWTIAHGSKEKVAVYARSSQMATHWQTRNGLSEEVKKNDGRVYSPPLRLAANANLPGISAA